VRPLGLLLYLPLVQSERVGDVSLVWTELTVELDIACDR